MEIRSNILCVDAGFRHMGIAVWSITKKKFIHTLLVNTEKGNFNSASESNVNAVRQLSTRLAAIIGERKPLYVLAELPVCGGKSANAVSGMAMAFALVVTACQILGVKLIPIKPSEIKRIADPSSKGNKKVDKEKVIAFVKKKYGDRLLPKSAKCEHIADAMACLDAYKARRQ